MITLILLFFTTLSFAAIDAAEYSWDVVAAPGSGISLNISGDDTAFVSQRIAVNALTTGQHRLFIRMRDDVFGWGDVDSRVVYKFPAPLNVADSSRLSGAECFVGSDPGAGMGISLSADDGIWDEANEPATAFVEPNLSGRQLLGVRFRDNLGQWSNVNYDTVDVDARLVLRTVGTSVSLHWTRGVAGQPFTLYRAADVEGTFDLLAATADSSYSDTIPTLPMPTRWFYRVTQTRP